MDGVLAQIRARRRVIEVEDDAESQVGSFFRQNSETGSLFRQSSGRSIGSERLKRLQSLRKLSNRSLSFRSTIKDDDDGSGSVAHEETKDEEESKDPGLAAARRGSSQKNLSTPPVPPPPPGMTCASSIVTSERDRRVSSHVSDADVPSPPPTPPSLPTLPAGIAARRPPPGLDTSFTVDSEASKTPAAPPTPLEAESKLQRHLSTSSSRRSGFGEPASPALDPRTTLMAKEDLEKITRELAQLRSDVKDSQGVAKELDAARKETARAIEARTLLQTQIDALRAQLKDSQTSLQHERELKNQLQQEIHASRNAVLELKSEIQSARAREESVALQAKEIERLEHELQSARADAKKVLDAVATMVGGRRELLRLTTTAPESAAAMDLLKNDPSATETQTSTVEMDQVTMAKAQAQEPGPQAIPTRARDPVEGHFQSMEAAQRRVHLAQYRETGSVQWASDAGASATAVVSTLERTVRESDEYGSDADDVQAQVGISVQAHHRAYAQHVGARVDHLRNALEHARRRERTQGRLLTQARRKCAYTYM